MKTEQFSRVEHLVEIICDQNDKLYDGINQVVGINKGLSQRCRPKPPVYWH